MSAHVQSQRAIAEFRAALCTFIVEARQALAAIEMEARRAIEYITHDQAQAWNHEVRRGRENVQQCKLDIHNTRTFKRVGHYTPSCIDEKKELDKAQRRLHMAEAKVEAVRHWGRVAEQAFREFHTRLTQFTSLLDGDMPKAVAALERVLTALDRYLAVETPAALTTKPAAGQYLADSAGTDDQALEAAVGVDKPADDGANNSMDESGGAALDSLRSNGGER
jgi:hypothetical protein